MTTPDAADDQRSEEQARGIDQGTRDTHHRDAHADHGPDREPTPDEERAADDLPPLDDEVRSSTSESYRQGADARGEGRIDAV